MLSKMNDEERFRTSFHLSQEILQGIIDNKVKLEEASELLKVRLTKTSRRHHSKYISL